jgi:hypothetical protein
MKPEEIKTELEKNYGWNFSSEENMEMYYELFLDVQKVVLRQPPVIGSVCQCKVNRMIVRHEEKDWCNSCGELVKAN